MKLKFSMVLAASAILSPAAFAKSSKPDPANPAFKGVTSIYESALRDYRSWKDAQEAPPKTWRAMNANVTQSAGGMAGMKVGKGGTSMSMSGAPDPMPMPVDHTMRHKEK